MFWTKAFERNHWPLTGVTLISLLAFAARVYDLGSLTLYGDYAYSVYAAGRDWITIAQERVLDGHPPLYYYLLHAWMLLLGQKEFALRYLSVAIGVLIVPLAFALGKRMMDRRVGLLGALLVAVSPSLVQYSRQPRMYILLVLFAMLSILALGRAIDNGKRRDWCIYAVANVLLLYTHYYGLALVVAEAIYVVWARRALRTRRPGLSRPFIVALAVVATVYLPWLLYAAMDSAVTTAGIIADAPWPQDIQGLLEELWIPLNVGDHLDISLALPFALAVGGLWIIALLFNRNGCLQQLSGRWGLLLAPVLVSISGSLLVYAVAPYAVRPRFLIFCIPFYLILLAALIAGQRRWLMIAGLALALLTSSYALVDGYRMDPFIVEYDSIALTQQLQKTAQPDDAVVFHAYWEIGYFKSHYIGTPPSTYSMRDFYNVDGPAILARHPRVWLAMFRSAVRDPKYPLEEWLDRTWYRSTEVRMGETRLILYSRPATTTWQETRADFAAGDGGPVLRLTSFQIGTRTARPLDSIPIGLQWQALRQMSERYTMFVKIVDASGRSWAGYDGEPLAALTTTNQWEPGGTVQDHVAVTLPDVIAPGDYTIQVGIHPTGDPRALSVASSNGAVSGSAVTIGSLYVASLQAADLHIQHRVTQDFGDSIALLGYDLDTDFFRIASTRSITALTDNPIQLVFPKRSYSPAGTIDVTLYWQALRPMAKDYTIFAHLLDKNEKLWGQVDVQPIEGNYPTSRWRSGDVIVDHYRLPIDPAAPPGDYQLKVGMYLLSSMERLPVLSAGKKADEVLLQNIKIDAATQPAN